MIIVSIKIYKKAEIKWLKFWLSQKVKICLDLNLEIFLSLNKFKMLVLESNLTF